MVFRYHGVGNNLLYVEARKSDESRKGVVLIEIPMSVLDMLNFNRRWEGPPRDSLASS
jgi:hypothetical protein